eukprot:gene8588-9293_t
MSTRIPIKIDLLTKILQRYADGLASALQTEFGADIQVKSVPDKGTTGRFEVTIVPEGKLIYSKATRGQSKCESAHDREEVISQIREYMDAQK